MLEIGAKLPQFEAYDQDEKLIKSEDLIGKKLVIYFYPKDNTSGCTAEACDLRDNIERFRAENYTIIGISKDSVKSHKNFQTKYELPFSLLADCDTKIQEAFGVWAEKKMYGRTYMGTLRTTFIFDEKGILQRVISKVKTKEHSSQIFSEE